MIRNYFYLTVGLLCILFAVTHTLNGTTTTLALLDNVETTLPLVCNEGLMVERL